MIYSYTYSSDYDPAMPVIDLEIGLTSKSTKITVSALVDSGADATMVPIHLITQLGATSQEKRWLSGIAGGRYSVGMYTLFVKLGSFEMYVPVVGDPTNNEVILGRDVLNHLIVALNGLAETVEIST